MSQIKIKNGAKLLKYVQFPHKNDNCLQLIVADAVRGVWATIITRSCRRQNDKSTSTIKYFNTEAEAHADFIEKEQALHEASIAWIYEGAAQ